METVSNDEVKEITSRLDTVIKLLAVSCTRDMNNNDAIVRLEKMQLSREQIADAVGVTTHNVAQVLYAAKKSSEKKGKKATATNGNAPVVETPAAEAQPQ